jgi:1-acyl-sn-glycerol-3-phosphate acyltransferase
LSTPLRRLGAVVDRPAEVASLLRGGHIVGLPLAMQLRSRMRAGRLSPADVAPALQLGIPVIPVAVVGGELSGRWRVYVGEPIDPPRSQGPLALADLADGAQEAVQFRLDEAFPPRWPWG